MPHSVKGTFQNAQWNRKLIQCKHLNENVRTVQRAWRGAVIIKVHILQIFYTHIACVVFVFEGAWLFFFAFSARIFFKLLFLHDVVFGFSILSLLPPPQPPPSAITFCNISITQGCNAKEMLDPHCHSHISTVANWLLQTSRWWGCYVCYYLPHTYLGFFCHFGCIKCLFGPQCL